MRKILFSNVLEQELLHQWYTGLHERSMLSQIMLCRSLCLWYNIEDMELRIGHIISLFAHNSQKCQNHKSLEPGIVVKRVVLAFVALFCFVIVHLLFCKVSVHLQTLCASGLKFYQTCGGFHLELFLLVLQYLAQTPLP